MTTLVVGASGATGSKLVEQLLSREQDVKVIVRAPERLPDTWKDHERLTIISGSISEIPEAQLADYVKDCDAIASCLGHNITWKGIYGKPRRLVADTARRLCDAARSLNPTKPVKYVLMNTTGNRNRDLNEPVSLGHRIVITLLRLLLPPHVDNEKAADYLRVEIGQGNKSIEWAAVRPDNLIDEDEVTPYDVHRSPIRDPIFSAGKTSRINVAHFMADLIADRDTWTKWNGQMPVIYNKAE